ncbi:MAG TPA: ribosome-associated translation inhibitor RaiA [Rhabdochlamydiaceae bacterium]|jgi:putative sigma-54 modulation protein
MVDIKKFEEEEALGYNLDIVGRNIEVTETMRAYIWNKISKIERFQNHIMYVHMALELQKLEHFCTIVLKFNHFKIKVQASSTDMYVSIDEAINRLQIVISRFKSRIQDHHKKALSAIDMEVNVVRRPYDDLAEINADIEAENAKKRSANYTPPKVIGKETKPLKILTLDEAIMKMELSNDQFLLFRAEEDRKLKVIYRRTDGNYGLILPE